MEQIELIENAKRTDLITKEFWQNLIDATGYGSMGTLNFVIDILQILKERISNNQKIKLEDCNEYLTESILQRMIEHDFSSYVIKSVYKKTKLENKVFFNLENTKEGLDLVYTGDKPNKLFKWIADIDEQFCFMRLLPTNVVYIRDNKNNQYIPYLSEHNSCYIYDEENGKIKEFGVE